MTKLKKIKGDLKFYKKNAIRILKKKRNFRVSFNEVIVYRTIILMYFIRIIFKE